MSEHEFSVVLSAHDEARLGSLRRAVESLRAQDLQPREVIVVVDNNEPLFRKVEKELDADLIIQNTQAPGLGGARNSGLAAASAPIVAFMDDDAVAPPSWLSRLADGYAQSDVAGVGGSIEPLWPTTRPRWFPPEFDWVLGCTFVGMPETVSEVRNLIGCNMSFRKELIEELGGFRLGYGCDETELSIRLHRRWPERKLLYLPEAHVFHQIAPTRLRLRRFLARCYFEGGSKAVVSHLVGRERALSNEKEYVLKVLPSGFARGIADTVVRRDTYGLARSAVTTAGLVSTIAGFLAATMRLERAAARRGWSPDSDCSTFPGG